MRPSSSLALGRQNSGIMLLMAGSSPSKPQLTISVSMSSNAAKNAVLSNRFKILKLIEGHAGQFQCSYAAVFVSIGLKIFCKCKLKMKSLKWEGSLDKH